MGKSKSKKLYLASGNEQHLAWQLSVNISAKQPKYEGTFYLAETVKLHTQRTVWLAGGVEGNCEWELSINISAKQEKQWGNFYFKNEKMKKDKFITKYGEEAWKEKVGYKNSQNNIWMKKWRIEHLSESRERGLLWRKNNPIKVKLHDNEISRKGGKYYEAAKRRGASGIPNEKRKIRGYHYRLYRDYKKIIAPDSDLHHSWLNNSTAEYAGVALVESDQHRHGIIDVIEILEGEIPIIRYANQ